MSCAIFSRMNANHLWYVLEEFVPVTLVSTILDDTKKREIADAILVQPKAQLTRGAIKMPHITDSSELKDRVGPNSWHFFDALSINTIFLSEPVSDWPQIPAFCRFKSFVQNMPVTNDESERLVRRTVKYANVGPKGEAKFQAQLQIVGDALARVPPRYNKKELVAASMGTN